MKKNNRFSHKTSGKTHRNKKVSSSANLIKGKIVGNKQGYAFLVREDSDEDIFIPASALNGAINDDEVLVSVTNHQEGKKCEGRVEKILSHNLKTVVGQIQVFKGFSFVYFFMISIYSSKHRLCSVIYSAWGQPTYRKCHGS